MWSVLLSKKAQKEFDKAPLEVQESFEAWKNLVQAGGPSVLLNINGYWDHPLRGEWAGARSSSLNIKWRVIYVVESEVVQVAVLEFQRIIIGVEMATKEKLGKKVKDALKGEFSPLKSRATLTPGKALKIYRELQGLSQLELAEKAHLKQATISALENDRITLGLDRAKSLARALEIHPSVLAFPDWDTEKKSA